MPPFAPGVVWVGVWVRFFTKQVTLFNGQVVSLYCVAYWGHPADLWYSTEPLERNDPAYEAELRPLSLSAKHVKNPDQFDICVQGKMVVFRAGDEECALELA